jgi:hypothetical protein
MEVAGKFFKRRLEEFEALRAEIDSLTLEQKMFNDTNTEMHNENHLCNIRVDLCHRF